MIMTMIPFSIDRRTLLAAAAFMGVAALSPAAALAPGFEAYTKAKFDAALKDSKPVLIHVHASWCPTCKKQEIVFNELGKTADFAKVKAFVVDFDMETEFKKDHKVANQSILLLFKGGKEIARSGGMTDKAQIAAFVAGAFK